jgi:hypothetical protein
MAWVIANMAPLMFGALVLFLLFGYPVAFALAANGIVFGLLGIELGLLHPALFQALPERIFGIMANDTLLAIPFFTFMGLILERSGMAEDLLDTIGQLFGPMRGGLAYAVIFVGALLAATTGVVAASVISMGLISLPIMLRYGYDKRLAAGVIAASGTLAQIIPPSLVLIIMADQLGKSVGDMYEGAFVPGMVLTGMYVGYVMLMSILAGILSGAAAGSTKSAWPQAACSRTDHAGATAGPDLSGPRYHFSWCCHPNRRRRNGRSRSPGTRRCPRTIEHQVAQAGHGNYRQTVVVCHLHSGWVDRIRPGLPWGQR